MNRFLRCLSNRSQDFLWLDLKSPLDMLPDPEGGAVDEVRTLLGLKRTDTDYFVIGALAAFATCPDLMNWFGSDETTYDLSTYSRPSSFFPAAQLLADRFGLPVMGRIETAWPARIGSKLIRVSDTQARWQCGNEIIPCAVRVEAGDVLNVEWPVAAGISGRLQLSGSWEVMGEVEIADEPINYPAAALLSALLGQQDATDEVVRRAGLQEAFYGAVTPLERVAAVFTALATLHRESGIPHA